MTDWRDLAIWQELERPERAELLTLAASIDAREASAVARLRRKAGEGAAGSSIDCAALASAALELSEGRRRARVKFPEDVAGQLWCDVAGVEQASGMAVARWKAERMAAALGAGAAILDICSGIGGDAMALAEAGLAVEAIDLDPRRGWMTAQNASCTSRVADAETLDLAGVALHADPARREEGAGRRSWNLDDHRPGRAWIDRALTTARAAAIKFSPGVARADFAAIATPIAWEWIAEGDRLVQAVAWAGAFAGADGAAGQTRATSIVPRSAPRSAPRAAPDEATHSIAGLPDDARDDRLLVAESIRPGDFISEPIAALERAALLTEAAACEAQELARGLGLVVSRTPLVAPWFESFEFIEECAARDDALRAALARHALVARSVRVRGRAADADAITRALGARPEGSAVVFIQREGKRARALVARAR
ncbi:MAG: class I SAM-dependent methyltransferase [bacterium]